MTNTNKVIVNTGVTYISLAIRMLVSLISVRLILQVLGEEGYGIYIIVGGIVVMLDILNTNMTNTSMRYLAYSLGSDNKEKIKVTFNTTIIIHFLIGIISIIILEVGGMLMFDYFINIPEGRMWEAKAIFQIMVVTTFVTVISVPFDAVMNAHEKIWMLSIFDVITSVLKLCVAILLIYLPGNRLISYALLLLIAEILMRTIKVAYVRYNFPECRNWKKSNFSSGLMKEILSFTGWNLLGSIAALGAGQFRTLITNFFFGVRLNAAQGIATQISTPLNQIVAGMTQAINPQIMKSEGAGNHERMKNIVSLGAKYSTFLMALFGIPVLIEASFLLKVWLKEVPQYAVIFVQLSIVAMLMEKFTFQLNHAISAIGNIKGLQISSSIINLIYLPFAWIMFENGYPPPTIYWLFLGSLLLMALTRLYYAKKIAKIQPLVFIKSAVIPVLVPMLIATMLTIIVNMIISNELLNLVVVVVFYCITFSFIFWRIGLDQGERQRWLNIFAQIKIKLIQK